MAVFSTSTVPAFEAALIAALKARPGLVGVSIGDGPPAPATGAGKEFISLGDIKGDVTVRALNRVTQPRDERYSVDVIIESRLGSKIQTAATARAFELYGELEALVREDVTLDAFYDGPGKIYSVVIGTFDLLKDNDGKNRTSTVLATVDVHARLSP